MLCAVAVAAIENGSIATYKAKIVMPIMPSFVNATANLAITIIMMFVHNDMCKQRTEKKKKQP